MQTEGVAMEVSLELPPGLPPFCPLELRSAGILQPSAATPGRHAPRSTFRERPSTAAESTAAAAALAAASATETTAAETTAAETTAAAAAEAASAAAAAAAALGDGEGKQSSLELDLLPPVRSRIARTVSLPSPNQVGHTDPHIQGLKARVQKLGLAGTPDSPTFPRSRTVISSSSSGKLAPSLAPVSERIWELAHSGDEGTELGRERRPSGRDKSEQVPGNSWVGHSDSISSTAGRERRGRRHTRGGGSARQGKEGEPRTDSLGKRLAIEGDRVPSTATSPSAVPGSRRSGRLKRPQRTSSCPKQFYLALSGPNGGTSLRLRCLHPTVTEYAATGLHPTLSETLSGPLSFSGEGSARVFSRAWASFQERPQRGLTTTLPPRPVTSISVPKGDPREEELLFCSTPGGTRSRLANRHLTAGLQLSEEELLFAGPGNPGRSWSRFASHLTAGGSPGARCLHPGDSWAKAETCTESPESTVDQRPQTGGSSRHVWGNHTKAGSPQEDMAATGLYTPKKGMQTKDHPWRMTFMEGSLLTSADLEVVGRGQCATSGDVVGDIDCGAATRGVTGTSRVPRVSSCSAASEAGYGGPEGCLSFKGAPEALGGDRVSPTRFLQSWGVDHQDFVFPLVHQMSRKHQCKCKLSDAESAGLTKAGEAFSEKTPPSSSSQALSPVLGMKTPVSKSPESSSGLWPDKATHAKRHAMSEIPEGFLESIGMKQHAEASALHAQVATAGQARLLEGGKGSLGRGGKGQRPPPAIKEGAKEAVKAHLKADQRIPNSSCSKSCSSSSSSSWRLSPLPRLLFSCGPMSQVPEARTLNGDKTKNGGRHPAETGGEDPSAVQRAPLRRNNTVCQQVLGSILGPKHLGEDSGRGASGKHLKQQHDPLARMDWRKQEAASSFRGSPADIDTAGEHAASGRTGGLLRAHLRRLLRNRSDPVERGRGKKKLPVGKAAVQQAKELEPPMEEVVSDSESDDDDSESCGDREGGSFVTLISFSDVSAPQHRRSSSAIDIARARFL